MPSLGPIAKQGAQKNLLRAALLGVVFCIAQIEDVGRITNLVGGFAQCSLALVLPPAIALRLQHRQGAEGSAEAAASTRLQALAAVDWAILTFGVSVVGLTTFESLRDLAAR